MPANSGIWILPPLIILKNKKKNVVKVGPTLTKLITVVSAYMGPRATTEEHYERSFGVNYLGHFLLTNLLYDRLKRGAPSRIINVVSDSYKKAKLDLDDLALANYDMYKAYARLVGHYYYAINQVIAYWPSYNWANTLSLD